MKSEYIDMLDGYFSDALNEQEKANLKRQLQEDINFQQAFREYEDLRMGIDYSIMKTLKEELQELEATLPEVKLEPDVKLMIDRANQENYYKWWKVAAVILLIAASSAVLMFQLPQSSNPQDLFSQHFEPYENQFVSAKRGDDIANDPLVQSFQAYDAEDYSSAIAGFEIILEQEENSMVLFYLGSAQLAEDQSGAAITTFERYLEVSQDNIPEAKWYLALSYLKESRVDDAGILLEELKDSEEYGKEAARILKRLK